MSGTTQLAMGRDASLRRPIAQSDLATSLMLCLASTHAPLRTAQNYMNGTALEKLCSPLPHADMPAVPQLPHSFTSLKKQVRGRPAIHTRPKSPAT